MRVNVYAEEMTDRVELVQKATADGTFVGVRFFLYLPVTVPSTSARPHNQQHRGPFIHRPGDDDSAAVTFWGKRALRPLLVKALELLDAHDARMGRQRTLDQGAPPIDGGKP